MSSNNNSANQVPKSNPAPKTSLYNTVDSGGLTIWGTVLGANPANVKVKVEDWRVIVEYKDVVKDQDVTQSYDLANHLYGDYWLGIPAQEFNISNVTSEIINGYIRIFVPHVKPQAAKVVNVPVRY